MVHNHQHEHGLNANSNMGKAFWISIALNLVYVCAEIIFGLMYNSVALLTDAGHNVSDIGSLFLSLLAFLLSKKKPNKKFTYGFKKTTVLAALANAVILLIAIGVLGYETIRRLGEPYAVQGDVIAWVAGVGILVNGISALLFFKSREYDLNIKSAYLHLLADAFVSIGVVIAGIVIAFTGWYILDPVIGMIVLFVILLSTWNLFTDSFKLSVDAVPAGIDLENIKKVIEEVPDVEDVHHVHIWAISTTENALTAHVRLNKSLNSNERMDVIKNIRHKLEHENIGHSTLEIENRDANCNNETCKNAV